MNTLTDLFNEINSKINNNVQLINCSHIMKQYNGDDWIHYASFCDKAYKRNLILQNDKLEMLLLCWSDGQMSGIHDHPENGCIMLVLDGKIREDVYYINKCGKIILKKKLISDKNKVYHKKGKRGLHNIVNINNGKSVTLHIYAPPNYVPTRYIM